LVGPWIHALFRRGGRLSDIEYLSIKEFDGKLVQNDSTRTTTGDLATLTASSGKDMYLAIARVDVGTTDNTVDDTLVRLLINGTVIEAVRFELDGDGIGWSSFTFASKGFKVAATQIIKLEVINIGTNHLVEGTLICFEEATGESPQIS